MKKVKRFAVALAALVVVLSAGIAAAHTEGGQQLLIAAYKPIANGYFMGTADSDCTTPPYGTGCITASRQVEVRAQGRKCLNIQGNTCTQWSSWQDSSPPLTKTCEKSNNHCSNNATTLTIDSSCQSSIFYQYRSKVRGRFILWSGAWSSWTSFKYSVPAWGTECDDL